MHKHGKISLAMCNSKQNGGGAGRGKRGRGRIVLNSTEYENDWRNTR